MPATLVVRQSSSVFRSFGFSLIGIENYWASHRAQKLGMEFPWLLFNKLGAPHKPGIPPHRECARLLALLSFFFVFRFSSRGVQGHRTRFGATRLRSPYNRTKSALSRIWWFYVDEPTLFWALFDDHTSDSLLVQDASCPDIPLKRSLKKWIVTFWVSSPCNALHILCALYNTVHTIMLEARWRKLQFVGYRRKT